MRVLLLTHRLPFPPNKGDKIRSFNILRWLARRHEVYVACPVDDQADLRYVPDISSRVRELVYEPISPRVRKALALGGLLRSRSITVSYFHCAKLQRRIDELLERVEFDLLFCFCSPMAEYLFRSRHAEKVRRAVCVMDLVDVDSYKWRQYAREASPWKSWIFGHEARHLAAYERRISAFFDRVLLTSEQEKTYFPGGAEVPHLTAVHNGVDLEFFSPAHTRSSINEGPALVFTGVMDYWPNIDGVKWFVEKVLPFIRLAVPEVRLFIVGSRPTPEVRRLSEVSGVVVTGFVEDIRDYVSGASVCIVPLRIARGIQNKVLEAMAMGKAVVTTPQAFEGIKAQAGHDLLVAEGEESFATLVTELLQDASRAQQIGRNARLCVERHYHWDDSLRVLGELAAEPAAQPAWDAGSASAAAVRRALETP